MISRNLHDDLLNLSIHDTEDYYNKEPTQSNSDPAKDLTR